MHGDGTNRRVRVYRDCGRPRRAGFRDVQGPSGTGGPESAGEVPTEAALSAVEADAGAMTGVGGYRGHIPLIDRVAWLIVGFALGVAATLYFG